MQNPKLGDFFIYIGNSDIPIQWLVKYQREGGVFPRGPGLGWHRRYIYGSAMYFNLGNWDLVRDYWLLANSISFLHGIDQYELDQNIKDFIKEFLIWLATRESNA